MYEVIITPNLAGDRVANPAATILSVAMMIEYLGYDGEAARVEAAVLAVLADGPQTPDLGGGAMPRRTRSPTR